MTTASMTFIQRSLPPKERGTSAPTPNPSRAVPFGMGYWFSALIILVVNLSSAGAQASMAQSPEAREPSLRIDVSHPPAKEADVRVGLYTSASNWLDEEPVHGMLAHATDTLTSVVFDSLPEGTYGAAVYLDENRNGELDRTFLVIFKEPYGFSRDARVRRGPPRWDDATFEVSSEPVRLYIRLE